jgi:dihydrofolate reductase
MAGHFPTAADPIAEVMNSAPKAVFSRTLRSADWAGTTIVGGDIAEELDKLKRQGDGEILAHGGVDFAQQLASHDLVDEYRLNVFPSVAGSGRTLVADVAKPAELELVSSTAFDGGQIALVYRRARGH